MYVAMHACMYECMHVCMYVRMYVCMYVCMCVCSPIRFTLQGSSRIWIRVTKRLSPISVAGCASTSSSTSMKQNVRPIVCTYCNGKNGKTCVFTYLYGNRNPR